MPEFFNQFESLLRTAFTGGIEAQPLSFRRFQQKHLTRKEVKRFYAGCHRGYDKAQNKIVETLADLQNDASVAEEEKLYREFDHENDFDSRFAPALAGSGGGVED